VVDNGSIDGSLPVIYDRFPTITVIDNGKNLGYPSGINVGLRYSMAQNKDCTLLLNNDTEVASDSLRQLVKISKSAPSIGVVGPTIYYYDKPDIIWSAGGKID